MDGMESNEVPDTNPKRSKTCLCKKERVSLQNRKDLNE